MARAGAVSTRTFSLARRFNVLLTEKAVREWRASLPNSGLRRSTCSKPDSGHKGRGEQELPGTLTNVKII